MHLSASSPLSSPPPSTLRVPQAALRQAVSAAGGVAGACGVAALTRLRSDIRELIKFVALNYLAVVKAIKKRNRHLRVRRRGAAGTSRWRRGVARGVGPSTRPSPLTATARLLPAALLLLSSKPEPPSFPSCPACRRLRLHLPPPPCVANAQEVFGSGASTSLQPLDLLGSEVFFTSPRLAALATQAEVFLNELASTSQPSCTLEVGARMPRRG